MYVYVRTTILIVFANIARERMTIATTTIIVTAADFSSIETVLPTICSGHIIHTYICLYIYIRINLDFVFW